MTEKFIRGKKYVLTEDYEDIIHGNVPKGSVLTFTAPNLGYAKFYYRNKHIAIKPKKAFKILKEQEEKVENCICGNGNAHSRECKTHRERLSFLERQKKIRKEKRANHICTYGGCKEKIKPIPYYFQFCNKHKPKPKTLK